jgi:hypothetical protein
MAIQDTLSAIIRAEIRTTITRIQDGGGGGDFSGLDRYDHLVAQAVQNGSGAREALGAFTSEFTIPANPAAIQLASTDPLGALGDDAPSTDPANSSLRAILFENLEDPVTGNFFSIKPATGGAGLQGWIEGTGNPELDVAPGGAELAIFPNGIVAWTTPGAGDTLDVEADNAPVLARLTYLFG